MSTSTTHSEKMLEIRTHRIVGVPIAMIDYQTTMNMMDHMIETDRHGYVIPAAVHAVMVARDDPEMWRAVAEATLTVPDGMPLVWAARLLGEQLPDRVYGPELMARYCEHAAAKGHRIWLYGGHDATALEGLERNLSQRYPGLKIVGKYCPPHAPLDELADERTAERINADRPDVVFVGIGVPKQEKWMARMRSSLDAPVLVGVGAAFDFHTGRIPQAPAWMQRRGLEWLFRVWQEPRRLLGRYLSYNPRFVAAFLRQYYRHRRGLDI